MTRGVGWWAFPLVATIVACSSSGGLEVDGGPVASDGAREATDMRVGSSDAADAVDLAPPSQDAADAVDQAPPSQDAADAADVPAVGPDAVDAADLAPPSQDAPDAHADVAFIDAAPTPIWTDASAAIDVRCVGYFEGPMRFRARRDQMTAEQLSLLANVTLLHGPLGECVPDVLICNIAVTGGDAGVASYITYAFDQICGAPPSNLVSNATFRPFASSLPCRYGWEGQQVLGGGPPPFAPDERCFNAIQGIGNSVRDPVLAVDEAGVPRHVEVGRWTGYTQVPLAFDILSEDGTTSVAQGAAVTAPNPDDIALRADLTFAIPGNYRLHLSVPGADAGGTISPGPLFYRFY